jgi:hypothetical protein
MSNFVGKTTQKRHIKRLIWHQSAGILSCEGEGLDEWRLFGDRNFRWMNWVGGCSSTWTAFASLREEETWRKTDEKARGIRENLTQALGGVDWRSSEDTRQTWESASRKACLWKEDLWTFEGLNQSSIELFRLQSKLCRLQENLSSNWTLRKFPPHFNLLPCRLYTFTLPCLNLQFPANPSSPLASLPHHPSPWKPVHLTRSQTPPVQDGSLDNKKKNEPKTRSASCDGENKKRKQIYILFLARRSFAEFFSTEIISSFFRLLRKAQPVHFFRLVLRRIRQGD